MKVPKTLSVRTLLEQYMRINYPSGIYIVYYTEYALNLNEVPWIDDNAFGVISFQSIDELRQSLGFWWGGQEEGLYVRIKTKFFEENDIEDRPHNLLCFIDGESQVIGYNPHNNGIEFEPKSTIS